MISILLEDKSIENFEKALVKLEAESSSIIILSCASNDFKKEALDPLLKASSVPIIGGIFPSIIYGKKQYDTGTILLGLTSPLKTTVLQGISQNKAYDDVIEEELGVLEEDINTMFLFFDGLSEDIDSIIQSLFNNYGLSLNYMGGSAGHADFQQRPVIFTNEGLLEDAAIFASSTAKSTIGVKHGWVPLHDEPLQVTKSVGNVIHEIDYKDAFLVYKEILESHSDVRVSEDFSGNFFFNTAKSFPLGINRLSGDPIVRVPSYTDGKIIACTGDVLENTYVQILHTTSHTHLINAARDASTMTQDNSYHTSFKLYCGCLARFLVLQDSFSKELEAIYEEGELLVGALTLGEIANNQDHYLELYNSTAVVAKVEDAR